jgi:hypothetical protein
MVIMKTFLLCDELLILKFLYCLVSFCRMLLSLCFMFFIHDSFMFEMLEKLFFCCSSNSSGYKVLK